MIFPDDHHERLDYPVFSGLLAYFPNACAAVARHSKVSNDQHNPGQPMHWAKEKSIGRGDKIVSHLMQGMAGDGNADEHLTAMAWRALELLERRLTRMPPFTKESEASCE